MDERKPLPTCMALEAVTAAAAGAAAGGSAAAGSVHRLLSGAHTRPLFGST